MYAPVIKFLEPTPEGLVAVKINGKIFGYINSAGLALSKLTMEGVLFLLGPREWKIIGDKIEEIAVKPIALVG